MAADCHIHMVLDGVDWKASIRRGIDETLIRNRLAMYAADGYTYLRDGGDRWGVGAFARCLAPQYAITYRTPLSPLCAAGHYGGFIGTPYRDLRHYARLVKENRQQGADFIKIMISGLMDFTKCGVLTEASLPGTQIREMIHIAHGEGLAVMSHCNGAQAALAAAQAGVDSIEHGAYLDEEAMAAMAEHGVVWTPTLSTIGNLLGKGRFPDSALEAILDSALENVSAFHEMGGLIASGTDAGAWAVPHGCRTEAQWLRRAGVDDRAIDRGQQTIMERF